MRAASGFASKKLNAARSARGHRTLAVDGVPTQLGPRHFEMTPTTEAEAATTNGELRHRALSTQVLIFVFASGKLKEAHSAKEYEVRVPAGAFTRLGQVFSVTTLITGAAAVSILGRSSHDTLPTRQGSRSAACASRKQKEALSVREIAKAAVDGAVLGIPPGPHLSVMTPTTVGEGVSIAGSWTVCQKQLPNLVHRTVHAGSSNNNNNNN